VAAAGYVSGLLEALIHRHRSDIYRTIDTNPERFMSATAKIFKHGRSQAVRLPKAFRLPGDEVRVTKVGDRVILEPLTTSGSMPWALIDQIGDKPFMPEGREQPDMPADRPIFDR
jgi:antitoxin VapB